MSIPTFVTTEPFAAGQHVSLGEDEAHHMRVRRLDIGAQIALLDGQGMRGMGVLLRMAKRNCTVSVESVTTVAAPRAVHLILPIADKDRMLWLAEKATELGVTSWRPVQFRRSRSVAARGEGTMFTQKVSARMASAMEQSGSAWMPNIFPDANLDRAVAAAPEGVRIVLDGAGAALATLPALVNASPDVSLTVAVGPEGGMEPDELERFTASGFVGASIGASTLRFETAAIAALGAIRARGESLSSP